jgi:hypothetical protein
MSAKSAAFVPAVALVALLVARSSHAIEPTKQECVAANESAQDLRQAGKLREAQVKLSVCVVASCPGPVREDCAQRLDEVVKAMPSVVFDVKDSAGRDLPDVRLSVDGGPAGSVPVIALALNPGQHVFRFEVAGKSGIEREVFLREGEKEKRVSVLSFNGPAELKGAAPTPEAAGKAPGLQAPAGEPAPAPVPTSPPAPTPIAVAPNAPSPETDASSNAARTWGYVLGAAGLLAGVVGSALTLASVDAANNAHDRLVSSSNANPPTIGDVTTYEHARTDWDNAKGLNQLGWSVAGIGAGLLGAGILLVVMAPEQKTSVDTSRVAPWIASSAGGVVFSGTW